MNLPFEQDDVGIYVEKVILEASYRRARYDLFDGSNDGLFKFPSPVGKGVGLAPESIA